MPTGTLTADGMEQTIATLDPGAPGFVFWYVDLSNLSTDDEVVIREKVDVDGDGNYELFTEATYADTQDEPVVSQSANLLVLSGVPVRISLEHVEGTHRDYSGGRG
jgi:hypothetical protein